MEMELRQKIANVVLHYQTSQATGIKDIEKQLEIFTDNCTFMSFSAAAVVGKTGIFTYNGKDEIRKGFQEYNDHIENPSNIDIEYFDLIIDEENLRCSFNMLLHIKVDPNNPIEFFNILQFHLNKDLEIYKAYNWQGDAGTVNLYDLLRA